MENGRRRGMLPILALHAVSEYYRLPWKPPVTAGLLAANTLIYLRPAFLRPFLPPIDQVWFNPHLILKYRDLKRFLLSALYHVSESHLVYNMMSLLWKGIRLETAMGSAEFASMVAALLAMSQGITLILAKSLLLFFRYDTPYYYEFSAGFSGVLFAMKVVLNSQSPHDPTYLYGLVVPARLAAWAELILIQFFVPGASFLGHLGGILAGILYLKLKNNSASSLARLIIKPLYDAIGWPLRFVRRRLLFLRSRWRRPRPRPRIPAAVWRCQACTYDNPGLLSVCEMCGSSRRPGVGTTTVPEFMPQSQYHDLTLEELRRRRIQRFNP
ncbi:Rhomboid-like protein 14, mitochondrial [Turnera subulata]|uniref:Rhomboid-like protein 14, mitochondrial n=1 Tax=Turnera subulata TaxID=218843 RepID=A0A9Q0GHD2_9ROSI|nr:Rhomboid-like protein 14, mitochondrial [Turnera subulata]